MHCFGIYSDVVKHFSWLVRDPHLKIIALVVSSAFWIFVSLDRVYQLSLELPVRINNLKDSLIVTSELPQVRVTFSGKGRELLKLKVRQPWIGLNLALARPGRNVAPISPSTITTEAMYLSVIKTSLNEVELFVSEKAEKLLMPTIVTQGEPKAGFTLREALSHATVKVAGPKDRLHHLREILTEPVDLNNENASFGRLVALVPPALDNITLSPCSVYVKVAIEERLERTFTGVPIHIIFPPGASAQIEPCMIDSLMIRGPKSIVTTVALEDFSITLDLRGKIRGKYFLPAQIRLPKYLKLVGSKPRLFSVTLR